MNESGLTLDSFGPKLMRVNRATLGPTHTHTLFLVKLSEMMGPGLHMMEEGQVGQVGQVGHMMEVGQTLASFIRNLGL